jgi:hypothetical protein
MLHADTGSFSLSLLRQTDRLGTIGLEPRGGAGMPTELS